MSTFVSPPASPSLTLSDFMPSCHFSSACISTVWTSDISSLIANTYVNKWEDPICHVLSSCIKCVFRRDLWEFITITSKTVQIQMGAIYYSQKQFDHFSLPSSTLPRPSLFSFSQFSFPSSFIQVLFSLSFFKYRFILIKILEMLLVFHVW